MKHCEILRQVMLYRNTNATQLSKISGINRQTIYSILRQNQVKTNSKIYIPICNALHIPESFFTDNEVDTSTIENFFIQEKQDSQNSDSNKKSSDNFSLEISELMEQYNKSYDDVFAALKYVGYKEYSNDELKAMIVNGTLPDVIKDIIIDVIIFGNLITPYEYKHIQWYRMLDETERDLYDSVLTKFVQGHFLTHDTGNSSPVENGNVLPPVIANGSPIEKGNIPSDNTKFWDSIFQRKD